MKTNIPALALLLTAVPAAAFHPLVTDDAGTQGKGRSQVELAVEVGRDACGEGEHRRDAGAATIARGLTDSLDLQAAIPYERSELSAAEGSARDVGAGRDPVFVMTGLVWSPAPWIDLDAGLKRGVAGTEERVTALFGTTIRF